MGIPGGPDIMNAVVLVAVLSCLNSSLYTASRMMFVLANQGDAPRSVARVDKNGVPRGALLAALCVGLGCVALDYFSPTTAFAFIVNASGATILMVYLMIALSQIKLRSMLGREKARELRFKMWLFPYLSILGVVGILAVLISMFFVESTRSQISLSLGALAVTLIAYQARRKFGPGRTPAGSVEGGNIDKEPDFDTEASYALPSDR